MDAKFRRIIRVFKKYTDICENRPLTGAEGRSEPRDLFDFYKKSDKLFHGGGTVGNFRSAISLSCWSE